MVQNGDRRDWTVQLDHHHQPAQLSSQGRKDWTERSLSLWWREGTEEEEEEEKEAEIYIVFIIIFLWLYQLLTAVLCHRLYTVTGWCTLGRTVLQAGEIASGPGEWGEERHAVSGISCEPGVRYETVRAGSRPWGPNPDRYLTGSPSSQTWTASRPPPRRGWCRGAGVWVGALGGSRTTSPGTRALDVSR